MPKNKKVNDNIQQRHAPPAITEEGREQQLISLAVSLAEKQLREGTASSQVICHYLKLGSSREKVELEKMRHENELLRARTEALGSAKHTEEIYANALKAMRSYGYGYASDGEESDEDIDL